MSQKLWITALYLVPPSAILCLVLWGISEMAKKEPGEVILNIRMPASLHKQIQKAAEAELRSVTAEVIDRLRKSFEQPKLAAELGQVVREETWRVLGEVLRVGPPHSARPASDFSSVARTAPKKGE